ncbi:MAG: NAD(P)H-hydrate epimerase [Phycisphaerales bacterium]|nr:NAD(P)H-hydrate epimerase [Phycisphaerales bacterium]
MSDRPPDPAAHHAGDHEPDPRGHLGAAALDAQRLLVFSADALRRMDQLALERYGIPSLLLMENAARALADAALARLPEQNASAIVLCGPGNNGGDGLAAARHLSNAGVAVTIVVSQAEPRSQEARLHLDVARRMGLAICDGSQNGPKCATDAVDSLGGADLIVDALLGTGLTRAPEGAIRDLIHWTNSASEAGMPVIAADIPSGMAADTGEALQCAVRASTTVTFAGIKLGFLSLAAQPILGDVVVADIGIPRELLVSLGQRLDRPAHFDCFQADPAPAAQGRRPGRN